ncbi:HNH endonuclease [Paenibacillus thailandensis]|uniref:HNH endonuclease n=1 Tax=Paenibacillus thailandensis TaxID=393250 RepID=A0ABW5R2U0_9BACL
MNKSCVYCGRIHDIKFECPFKQKRNRKPIDKDDELSLKIRAFRSSRAWTLKAVEIQKRDLHMCQVCIRNLYHTINQYTYEGTSVHHIIPLAMDWDKRLSNDNLIVLCNQHHSYAERGLIPASLLRDIVREREK